MIFEPLVTQVAPTVVKWVIGLILTGLIGVFMYPFRRARAEWIALKKQGKNALKEEQGKIHAELVTQRNNCLATLQSQGVTQIELLGKTVAALDGVRLDLAEQTGCLRAMTAQPPRTRRAAAKK